MPSLKNQNCLDKNIRMHPNVSTVQTFDEENEEMTSEMTNFANG